MTTIGQRLREERNRLGENQEVFGRLGGVGKHAQINYEKGERSPDGDYFARIAAGGADVLYIITGMRQSFDNAEKRSDYHAVMAASEIAGMALTAEDADVLLAVARRLNGRK